MGCNAGAPAVTEGGGALWSGRFSTSPAPEAHALGRSLRFDVRLAEQDVRAGVAHVAALREAGLLDDGDAARLTAALREVGEAIAAGEVAFAEDDEDIHSVVERAVTERLGDLGARLHAGRSRNDLVVTDLRLWLLEAGDGIRSSIAELTEALVDRAREHADTVMPGTTHGRAAQPVTLGHHLLAHGWALSRDVQRLQEWGVRTSVSPLGAGAIATSTLGFDPEATAARLGFMRAFENSIDAVSDRDFVQEFLADGSIVATHASRLAADLMRWTDPALGWAELDEAYSTGSSMMPQKRNPDTAELARAKASRVAADFQAVTSMLQGLPLGYHRDLQEDKEPAFDAADTLGALLDALVGAVRTIRFHPEAMRTACADEGLYATDLAEALVRSGIPFREAHRRVGELLRSLADAGKSLRDVTAADWADLGVSDGAALLDPDRSVASRGGLGGPSRVSVLRQADAVAASLSWMPTTP
jgi:argininosuccinate lyase